MANLSETISPIWEKSFFEKMVTSLKQQNPFKLIVLASNLRLQPLKNLLFFSSVILLD